VCNKQHGRLRIVIPTEGGFAYGIARRIFAQQFFERRYKMSYRWLMDREHINVPAEVLEELAPHFTIEHHSYFSLAAPTVHLNLIGLTLKPTWCGTS
jgi:hypothetical protein